MSFGVISIILFFCKGTKNYPKSKKKIQKYLLFKIMFSTFATLHDKGFNIYCLSCMQDYGNKDVITYRKQEVKKEQEVKRK